MSRKIDKWLLVQWLSGNRSIVEWKSVLSPTDETNLVGTVVVAEKDNGTHEAATVICSARDRTLLERQLSPNAPVEVDDDEEMADKQDEEDFSASGSSWAPSDENASSDDEEVDKKKIKLELSDKDRVRRVMKPSHRADAINNILEKSRKRTYENTKNKEKSSNKTDNKSGVPDSTKKNNNIPNNGDSDIVSINVRDIRDMKQCFQDLFKILNEIKSPLSSKPMKTRLTQPTIMNYVMNEQTKDRKVKPEMNKSLNNTHDVDDSEPSDRSRSEELNRSDDNVLITNKFDNANNANKKQENYDDSITKCNEEKVSRIGKYQRVLSEHDANKTNEDNEKDNWVPIGSGKTLIHKTMFRRVNWKSYTVATRTLLLAAFPRRILATHSLTGKKSPAFQDKPAKLCLDPKIVYDVVSEITKRFKVKENLVRTIITTKCADECKMYKMQQQRKRLSVKDENNYDDMDVSNNGANRTC